MKIDYLVKQANEIAAGFTAPTDATPLSRKIAAHLTSYWTPPMRRQIIEHVRQADGAGLSEAARQAIAELG